MLNQQEAAEQLKKFYKTDLAKKHNALLIEMPGTSAWMEHRMKNRGTLTQHKQGSKPKSYYVHKLSDRKRTEHFRSLFPGLAESMEIVWRTLPSMPYSSASRPVATFRAPNHDGVVSSRRDGWVCTALDKLAGLNPDPLWLAAWAGHLTPYDYYGHTAYVVAPLLAASIDKGDRTGYEVFDILKQSATNQHEIGVMSNHVIRAMLQSQRVEAWEYIEKMLLAAQRQEGLRQSILESLPHAHPEAFRRMLRLILDEKLVRFAATVRAIDLWFGFLWDSMSTGHAQSIVERAVAYLDDPAARAEALKGDEPESTYLALWCEGHGDAEAAAEAASSLLNDRSPEKRWVGIHALSMFGLSETLGRIVPLLGDEDLRVAARAFDAISDRHAWIMYSTEDPEGDEDEQPDAATPYASEIFDRFETLLNRIQKKEESFKPLVFPWGRDKLTAQEIGIRMAVTYGTTQNAQRLLSHVDRLDPRAREYTAWLIAGRNPYRTIDTKKEKPKMPSPEARSVLIGFLGDPSEQVRAAAGQCLGPWPITDDEVARHEELLDRSASDLRTRAISRLLTQKDEAALGSAQRLLDRGKKCSLAGLELLRTMVEKGRAVDKARAMAKQYQENEKKPSKDAETMLAAIFGTTKADVPSVKDAFGLAKAFAPRPIPKLRKFRADEPTKAAVACIWSLEKLVEDHKTFELKSKRPDEYSPRETVLLGGLQWTHYYTPSRDRSPEDDRLSCPVLDLVEEWGRTRPDSTRDRDGLELVRAWKIVEEADSHYSSTSGIRWPKEIQKLAPKGCKASPKHRNAIDLLLDWMLRLSDIDPVPFFMDQIEGAFQRGDFIRKEEAEYNWRKRNDGSGTSGYVWNQRLASCSACWNHLDNLENIRRLDGLYRAANELQPRPKRKEEVSEDGTTRTITIDTKTLRHEFETDLDDLIRLWEAGDVGDDELLIRVISNNASQGYYQSDLRELFALRKPHKSKYDRTKITLTPRLDALLEKIRTRVLEIELSRGDARSPASSHAQSIDPSGGIDAVVPALANLGKLKLVRGYIYSQDNTGKAQSFSVIIRNSRPTAADTPEAFAKAAKAAGLSDERLVQLALYQPRWAEHVEHTLGWDGLVEGVLWLRMHTKVAREMQWFNDTEEMEAWEGKAAELTPISPESLGAGAVDRAWFDRAYAKLGAKRWEVLYDAAKYASTGTGHTRSKLFADAILGKVTEKDLTARITDKRNQEAARAIGLLAIKPGNAGKQQVLSRFKLLQELRRTSSKHGGSMLQASEKRAVEIGMENLAWTAGYPDPLRLQWAMEIEEFGDLAKGPIVVDVSETSVTLAVDEDGTPSLIAVKKGKTLKSVPPALKKDKKIASLVERVANLRKQSSRIRLSLEQAMCRGDEFTGGELATLFGHPLLKSMLSRLVMVASTKAGGTLIGYVDKNGKALRDHAGDLEPLKASDTFRIAHPLDLLATGEWHEWQRDCFRAERVQPFKQVFREVYTPIQTEKSKPAKSGGNLTTRYAGQQVQPRQALALFGVRGWVARPEEGVQRTFHNERVTVHVEFEEGFYTPAEIDGLTLAGVSFDRSGKYEPVAIADVPPRLFSEVMRDLDLVVSVAHRGGVDPEASQSTVEMRAALLRETCELLSMSNVRFENSRAIIIGELGEYALHLGSGVIHKLPGGTIWVIPVHSQYRGRIFLPFADDDPKTAEVISKALLLARDREIQDPAILAQIRAR